MHLYIPTSHCRVNIFIMYYTIMFHVCQKENILCSSMFLFFFLSSHFNKLYLKAFTKHQKRIQRNSDIKMDVNIHA